MVHEILLSALRMATPILFAALGGLFCERSGVINIALEAFLLVGAFTAAAITLAFGNPWLGFLGAIGSGALFGLFYGVFVIPGRANQIVVGTAFNLLAVGIIPFALKILYGTTGSTPSIPIDQRFLHFPLFAALALVILTWFILQRLPLGLWVSFAGENPAALSAAGVSVPNVRYAAVAMGGALAACGGASLSIYLASGYSRNMAAGRGFMALAALIFGRWQPIPTALACFFFALMESLQIRMQSTASLPLPGEFVQMLPYLATILALAGFIGKSRPPKALGSVFEP